MKEELLFLKEQKVDVGLIEAVEEFSGKYPVPEQAAGRVVKPAIPFYGKGILEMAIAALLKGENLLLAGPKATGKNILAENLAYIPQTYLQCIFSCKYQQRRPDWNRHLPQQRGGTEKGKYLSVRRKRRFWYSG